MEAVTFVDGKMPASTDLVSLWPADDGSGVRVRCDFCGASLGTGQYLNEAIKMWTDHQEEMKPHPWKKVYCSCGNDFEGDNFCMPSACQWET